MRARFAAGDRGGALRAFDRLSVALGELGLEPERRDARAARAGSRAALPRQGARGRRVELKSAPVAERAGLLATRADLLMATADRSAPAAYAEAAAAAGPDGMALRIRQAWAQLAGGDANAPLEPRSRSSLPARSGSGSPICSPRRRRPGSAAMPRRPEAAPAKPRRWRWRAVSRVRRAWRCRSRRWSPTAPATGRTPWQSLDISLLAPDLADSLFDGHLCIGEYALTCGEPLDRVRDTAEELHARAVRSGARRAQVFLAHAARWSRVVSGG